MKISHVNGVSIDIQGADAAHGYGVDHAVFFDHGNLVCVSLRRQKREKIRVAAVHERYRARHRHLLHQPAQLGGIALLCNTQFNHTSSPSTRPCRLSTSPAAITFWAKYSAAIMGERQLALMSMPRRMIADAL